MPRKRSTKAAPTPDPTTAAPTTPTPGPRAMVDNATPATPARPAPAKPPRRPVAHVTDTAQRRALVKFRNLDPQTPDDDVHRLWSALLPADARLYLDRLAKAEVANA